MSDPRRLSQYGASVRLEHASQNHASHSNTSTAPPGITSNPGPFYGRQDYNQMHDLLGTFNPYEINQDQEHTTERRVSHQQLREDEIDLPAAGHSTLPNYQAGLAQESFEKNVDAYAYSQGPTAPWNPAVAAQLSPTTLGNPSQRRQLSVPFSTPQRLQVHLASDEGYYTHEISQQDTRSVRSDKSNSVTHIMHRYQAPPRSNPDQQRARAISRGQASNYSMESQQTPTRDGTKSDAGSNVGTIQCPVENCTTKSKTQSDQKKHLARHNKEHICTEENCARKNKGFATINDLNRHKSTVHKMHVEGARINRCFAPGCGKPEKDWPRKDNFKMHLKKAHPNEDVERLMRRSEEWWEHEKSASSLAEGQQMFGNTAPSIREPVYQVDRPSTPLYSVPASDADQAQDPFIPEARLSQYPYVPQGALSPFAGPSRINQLSNRQFTTPQGYGDVSSENVNMRSVDQSSGGLFYSSSSTLPEQQHAKQNRMGSTSLKRSYAQTVHHGEHQQSYQQNWPTNMTSRPTSSHNMSRTASVQGPPGQIRTANQRPQTVAHFPSLQEERQDSMEGFPAYQQNQDPHEIEYHGDSDMFSGIGISLDDDMYSNLAVGGLPKFSLTQYEDPHIGMAIVDNTGIVDVDGLKKIFDPFASRTEDDPKKLEMQRFLETTLQSFKSPTGDASSAAASNVRPDTDKYIREVPNAAGKIVFECTYPNCNSSKKEWKLRSEIKKHLKRHSKPYGCTFDKCYRQFGSKSDWIRHERQRHSQQDCWRCMLPSTQNPSEDPSCRKVLRSRQAFVDHLARFHNVTKENKPDEFNSQVTKQHMNAEFQPQYWCGFHEAIWRLTKKGKEGIHERYDHIAQHITGEGRVMDDWMPAHGSVSRSELQKKYPQSLSESPIDEEEEDVSPPNSTSEYSNSPPDERSPPQGPVIPGSQHATPQHQQGIQRQPPPLPRASHALDSALHARAGQKRTSSTAGLAHSTQPAQRRANHWRCHACQHLNLTAISPACTNFDCSHEMCRMCTPEHQRTRDRMGNV